ncbi:MAG: class I SAM-dependent methyltransferase [Desulfobacula sp.]|nr:class I SAM-dependent methyltransferase [Desulfobacula sp.]
MACVKDRLILEAGCGAGRFTEILLKAGGRVVAADISSAVEANCLNCQSFDHYWPIQTDIVRLPFENNQFDLVICIGVCQHTPSPEKTIESLCAQVKPGGLLVLDHYTYGYPVTLSRRLIRSLLLTVSENMALNFCKLMILFLWPIHKKLWEKALKSSFWASVRNKFVKFSPVVDYHDSYPQLSPGLLKAWALLDTHDTLTDVYKHLRSAKEIFNKLSSCGMINIETSYGGNGVEARANKPNI